MSAIDGDSPEKSDPSRPAFKVT